METKVNIIHFGHPSILYSQHKLVYDHFLRQHTVLYITIPLITSKNCLKSTYYILAGYLYVYIYHSKMVYHQMPNVSNMT